MKKRMILTFIGVLFIIFCVGVASTFFAHSETFTNSTNLSDESIGKVKLHENISQQSFVEQYGKPLRKDDNDIYDYFHWKDGLLTASINKGKEKGSIMRLIIERTEDKPFENPLHTSKGIKLGDSKAKVIAKYGDNYYTSGEQGADIIGYIDHKQGITLEFWCNGDEKVLEIRLDDAEVI